MYATSLVIKQVLWEEVDMTNSFSSCEILISESDTLSVPI
jgi:hypothetical protein